MFKRILIFSLLFILVGCGNGITLKNSKDELKQTHPQQVRNQSTLQEELDYYEDYVDVRQLQKKKLADNDMENYSDPYVTEESQEIAKKLMENKDIIMTEVKIIDEQVFVAVRLRENIYGRNHETDIVTTIEKQVAETLKDEHKEIIVYTDHSQWQKLKNQHAKPELNSMYNDFFKDD